MTQGHITSPPLNAEWWGYTTFSVSIRTGQWVNQNVVITFYVWFCFSLFFPHLKCWNWDSQLSWLLSWSFIFLQMTFKSAGNEKKGKHLDSRCFVYFLTNCMAVIQLIPWSFTMTLFTSHRAPCLSNKIKCSENRGGEAMGCFMTIINVVKWS